MRARAHCAQVLLLTITRLELRVTAHQLACSYSCLSSEHPFCTRVCPTAALAVDLKETSVREPWLLLLTCQHKSSVNPLWWPLVWMCVYMRCCSRVELVGASCLRWSVRGVSDLEESSVDRRAGQI